MDTTDILVIGAGPCGLAVGVAAKRAGLSCMLLDRRTIVSTIERYPLGMTFFSTPELIEIGGVPFISSHEKPTRRDGLIYYRRVAEQYGLDVRPSEEVVDVAQEGDGFFRVEVRRPHTGPRQPGRLRHPSGPISVSSERSRTSGSRSRTGGCSRSSIAARRSPSRYMTAT